MNLEHQEASASSGVAREGRQAAVALLKEGEVIAVNLLHLHPQRGIPVVDL